MSARHSRPRSRNKEGRRRPTGPHLPRPLDGREVFSAGGPEARPTWQPDPRHGRGRSTAAWVHRRRVVHTPLSGARILSKAGLGSGRPDRMRAARPYAVLYDEKAVLNTTAVSPSDL